VLADSRLPFASSSVYGIALTDDAVLSEDIKRVLQPGGRAVLSSDAAIPLGLNELARDAHNVVAEALGPVISLRR
jgi:hypothetical protein